MLDYYKRSYPREPYIEDILPLQADKLMVLRDSPEFAAA